MKKIRNSFILILCFSFIGCAHARIEIPKPYVDPQYGMTKVELLDLIGKPQSIEIYKKSDQTRMEVYIYVKKYASSELKVPIFLIDNKVAGWGKTYYEDHITLDTTRIK